MEKLSGMEFWEKTLNGAKLVVAPMVDQSELAWRMLSRKYGAQLCYTPMFSANVFIRDATYRSDALASCPEDRPLIVQLCSNDPDTFLKAAKMAEDHCDAVDLNLGCPQAIAKRGHYGAFLQDEWDLIYKMVNLCHQHLRVPVTCKIRVFEDIDKTVRYAKMLESAGCQLLTVHGRKREQRGPITGLADWSYIKAVREAVSIPVFANGNIQYHSDVNRCLAETGAHGVMSAEGNLHNPALFAEIEPHLWDMAEEYLDLVDKYPCPLSYVRAHIFKLCHHALLVYTDVREMVGVAKTFTDIREATQLLKEKSLDDVLNYELDTASWTGSLPHPYWICQPYVRPDPKTDDECNNRKDKRVLQVPEGRIDQELSRNKLKKLQRNPRKSFQPRIEQYAKCNKCGNPKSASCSFDLCKCCCRQRYRTDTAICPAHNKLKIRKNWTRNGNNDIDSPVASIMNTILSNVETMVLSNKIDNT